MDHDAQHNPLRAKNGFTLIELLIVVATIGLLIAILLPALGKARLSAMNTVGATDIGSIGKAIFVYGADYKGTAPTLLPSVAGISAGSSGPTFLDPGRPYYQKRAAAGWTIWDNISNATLTTCGFPDGRGPAGLGILLNTPASTSGTSIVHAARTGYLADPKVFFHPVMRDFSITSGTARSWYNMLFNWGKYRGDAAIIVSPGALQGNPAYPGGNNLWTVAGGGPITTTVMYRGGDWTPNGDTNNYFGSANAGAAGFDDFSQMKFEANGFNVRILLMSGLTDNQAFRQGGQTDYMTGDGAMRVSKNAAFIAPVGPGNAAAGVAPLYTTINNSVTSEYSHPTTGTKLPGSGQLMTAACFLVEHFELGLF